jgi:hypothetical protein
MTEVILSPARSCTSADSLRGRSGRRSRVRSTTRASERNSWIGASRSHERQESATRTIVCLRFRLSSHGRPNRNLLGFKHLYHNDRSEIIWLPEHIAAFMRLVPLEMQRALIIGLHTRQCEGDLLLGRIDQAFGKVRGRCVVSGPSVATRARHACSTRWSVCRL